MNHFYLQQFRKEQIKTITDKPGVYILVDWHGAPLYVGASKAILEGLRARVSRHTTSARSDLLANQKMVTDEIAYVWLYECADTADILKLEHHLIFKHDSHRPLLNSKVPKFDIVCRVPEKTVVQLVPDSEIERMQDPAEIFHHNLKMELALLDYIKSTKDNEDTRRALAVRHSLTEYHRAIFINSFMAKTGSSKNKSAAND